METRVAKDDANQDQRTRQSQDRSPHRRAPADRRACLRGEGLGVLTAAGDGRREGARSASAAGAFVDELAPAVADELESRRLVGGSPEKPALHDRRGLAHALGCGVDTVDRLRRDGCPELLVGDAPRFELDRVLTWLRERRAT